MQLRSWCDYTCYYATRTDDGLYRDACENCNLNRVCHSCNLHCQYDTFQALIDLETKEEVEREFQRRLNYYLASYPLGTPSLKGKYFWSMECSGRGREVGFRLAEDSGVIVADEEVM